MDVFSGNPATEHEVEGLREPAVPGRFSGSRPSTGQYPSTSTQPCGTHPGVHTVVCSLLWNADELGKLRMGSSLLYGKAGDGSHSLPEEQKSAAAIPVATVEGVGGSLDLF